jgi:uncharacterized protein (TIGR02118 family)
MVKAIALIKRKPGISRDEFIKHYEQVHAPLAVKHLHTFKKYIRNYVIPSSSAEDTEFDCITEVWYEDMEGYQTVLNFMSSEAGRVIQEDAEQFIDTTKQISFLVDEKVSELDNE